MTDKPYVAYPGSGRPGGPAASPFSATYVSEPGKVSFGVQEFPPHYIRSLHRHNLWELIIIDGSSEGPGYVFFDGRWWSILPGAGVFVPRGYPHSWSSGKNRFKMLWVYGGSRDEAGRIYDVPEGEARPITEEEEKAATLWSADRAV
jgi:quercetin dioxygenase-like cupin family protein